MKFHSFIRMKKNNRYLVALISVFGLLMMNLQCDKEEQLPPLKYEFSEKLNLYPLKNSYAINDTIWIELPKTDKRLYDTKTNQTILLDTGIINFGANISPLYNTPVHPADGFGDFVTFDATKVDSFNHDAFGIYIQKQCSEPDFHFKIGFIPKYKGYYALPVGGNGVTSCGTATTLFAEIGYSFNINNTSKAVYLQIPEADRKQYAHTGLEYGMDGPAVYVFKVE